MKGRRKISGNKRKRCGGENLLVRNQRKEAPLQC